MFTEELTSRDIRVIPRSLKIMTRKMSINMNGLNDFFEGRTIEEDDPGKITGLVRYELPVPDGEEPAWYAVGKLPKSMKYSFTELWKLHPEKLGVIKIMGKTINTPRYQESYGQDYYYTGMMHKAKPIENEFMKDLLKFINRVSKEERKKLGTKLKYKQVLLNWYRDNNDYIGPHSDDESQLAPNSPIYSITLGASRNFRIIPKHPGGKAETIKLTPRTILIMGGTMQKHYKHSVPKTTRKLGKRINITFRLFNEDTDNKKKKLKNV